MRVALIGGTGDIGEGLALRLALAGEHEVVVGSRTEAKAQARATEYEDELEAAGAPREIAGTTNERAARRGDLAVLTVPPYHIRDTIESVASGLDADTVLVSPAVGMTREADGFRYDPPSAGSVTELAATAAPEGVPVVGAFHNLAAGRLADLEAELNVDTLVTGEGAAKRTVMAVAESVDGLRALDAGSLANSAEIEGVTPLLINVAMNNDGMHDVGVRFE